MSFWIQSLQINASHVNFVYCYNTKQLYCYNLILLDALAVCTIDRRIFIYYLHGPFRTRELYFPVLVNAAPKVGDFRLKKTKWSSFTKNIHQLNTSQNLRQIIVRCSRIVDHLIASKHINNIMPHIYYFLGNFRSGISHGKIIPS